MLQTLYESSIAFGMRKALQTEQGKGDMEGRIGTLEVETKDFERQVQLAYLRHTAACHLLQEYCDESTAQSSVLFVYVPSCDAWHGHSLRAQLNMG